MAQLKIQAAIGKHPIVGAVYADYKCLNPDCDTRHVISTIDAGLYKVKAIREAWVEFVKVAVAEIGRESLRQAGVDLSTVTAGPVVMQQDIN